MPDEKELTIEEMKSLVSLSTLLPALLDKIAAINKEVNDLKTLFVDLGSKFNNNTKAVVEYKKSVDELIEKQPNIKKMETDIASIKQTLDKLNAGVSTSVATSEAASKIVDDLLKSEKKEKTKSKAKEDDKVLEVVDKILADQKGRKTRLLTLVDVKNGFKVDDETAQKVLDWFENNKMYDPKIRMLTFPKKR